MTVHPVWRIDGGDGAIPCCSLFYFRNRLGGKGGFCRVASLRADLATLRLKKGCVGFFLGLR